ncbi:MAG: hypothetical protein COA97_06740 [Flavobacteriales bacterium]|nr:MAG: hypothetical protein COA97_06740 [Flavobacteriales bacterium]
MKSNKFVLIFLIKAIALYVFWYLVYDLWLKKVGIIDNLIVDNMIYVVYEILTAFGYLLNVDYHTIGIGGGVTSVFIATGCTGIELMALFAGFVIIFEGNWKNKLWYIPLGLLILHFLNILRVIALMFIGRYSQEMLEFNHKYTFTIVMYIITFIGWMIWVKYFSKINDSGSIDDEKVKSK